VLFILDEVMTSRLAFGGLASMYGLSPDLKCFGKYLGAGVAFGAFGGREDIMAVYDARNPDALLHHGTFNNTTIAVHAGYAALTKVYTPELCIAFTELGNNLLRRLGEVTKGTKCFFTGLGTIISVHFSDSGVQDLSYKEEVNERWDLKDLFWLEMMEEGFWIHRRGSICLMIVTPEEELDRFVKSVSNFLEKHCDLIAIST
jgi:glutamate-1-semialdehyde 2,1-aminomutase